MLEALAMSSLVCPYREAYSRLA